MNCWGMRNLILDSGTKEIQIQLASAPTAELHVTTHRYDHYKDVQDYGNRHGFSAWVTAETIVPPPNPAVCWKREVTSISVYNPNDAMQLFYIIEYDDATGVATVIDEKLLNPFESWTMDCICGCWNCWCGVNVYDEWDFVYANAYNLNFIGSCVNATRNNLTGMIDINIDPELSFDTWTNILSLCWWSVDLSSLAWGWSINVYDSWSLIHQTTAINMLWCLTATWDVWNSRVDIDFDPTLSYDVATQILTICWNDIELWKISEFWFVNASDVDLSISQILDYWFFRLNNTPIINLPAITNVDMKRMIIYIYNQAGTTVTVGGQTNVTLNGASHTIDVWCTAMYMIFSHWIVSTQWNRIS